MFKVLFIVFLLTLLVAVIMLLALVYSLVIKSDWRTALKILLAMIVWVIFPLVLPLGLKQRGLVKSSILGIFSMIFSPLTVVLLVVILVWASKDSLEYKDLKFTSREDIVALTNLDDLPEFEYVGNESDFSDGRVIRYEFKEPLSERIKEKMHNYAKNDFYWTEDTLCTGTSNEKSINWIYRHGWDGTIIPSPVKNHDSTQVEIRIAEKEFTLRYKKCYGNDVEFCSIPDSLKKVYKMDFPAYEIVDCDYYGEWDGYCTHTVLKLKKRASDAFVRQIEQYNNDKNPYSYFCFRSIDIDDSRRFVTIHYEPYY